MGERISHMHTLDLYIEYQIKIRSVQLIGEMFWIVPDKASFNRNNFLFKKFQQFLVNQPFHWRSLLLRFSLCIYFALAFLCWRSLSSRLLRVISKRKTIKRKQCQLIATAIHIHWVVHECLCSFGLRLISVTKVTRRKKQIPIEQNCDN